nr:unnamed protein product [Digitaria exilis]
MASCRKKKTDDDAAFLEDLKDHIDEFIHASMPEEEHSEERSALQEKEAEVESALPLQTSVSQ